MWSGNRGPVWSGFLERAQRARHRFKSPSSPRLEPRFVFGRAPEVAIAGSLKQRMLVTASPVGQARISFSTRPPVSVRRLCRPSCR